jgi:hypothetical protein
MKLLAAILTAWLLLARPSAARAQTSLPLPDNASAYDLRAGRCQRALPGRDYHEL